MANLFKRKKKDEVESVRVIPEWVLHSTFEPKTPSVNIIPAEVLTRYADDRMRLKFILACVILLVLGSFGFLGSTLAVNNSEKQLESLQEENIALQSESTRLSPGKQYIDLLNGKREALASKVSRDISYSKILRELNKIAAENDTQISNATVIPLIKIGEGETAPTGSCPSPDPFGSTTGIACISFSAQSNSEAGANGFGQALEAESTLFANVFIGTLSTSDGKTTMDGSVLANTEVLTTRFEGLNQDLYSYLEATLGGASPEDTANAPQESETPNEEVAP